MSRLSFSLPGFVYTLPIPNMKLIVGLGNPGIIYEHSRHNIGFQVLKALARTYKLSLKKERSIPALSGKAKIGGQNVILGMPLTFMNLSGSAVKSLLKRHRIGLDNLLVVCDDLDLEFGRLKLRPTGSSGGQRGIQSIIDSLGSQEFSRLRIGIGRPIQHIEASEYVLSSFNKKEKEQIKDVIKQACDCCQAWIINGLTESMNIFNRQNK
jgi:peptidyl-tRNA hydrolase, PTH1 family